MGSTVCTEGSFLIIPSNLANQHKIGSAIRTVVNFWVENPKPSDLDMPRAKQIKLKSIQAVCYRKMQSTQLVYTNNPAESVSLLYSFPQQILFQV